MPTIPPHRAPLRFWLLALTMMLAAALASPPAWALQEPTADWWSAIRRDDAGSVQDQLLRNVDPNAANERGNPALTQAVREQSWKVFDILRRAPGIQVDQPNALDETALMYLCILGETARAIDLIQAGAQVNRLGWTPLHYAASKARLETAQMLIERGAIINAPGPDGTTPLMMAALSGNAGMVRLLLRHGADATMFNSAHETAADWARRGNSRALAGALDDLAAQVAQSRRGSTPAPGPAASAGGIGAAAHDAPAGAGSGAQSSQADAPGATDDPASFSRYFDLGRFEDASPGK